MQVIAIVAMFAGSAGLFAALVAEAQRKAPIPVRVKRNRRPS